MAELTMGLMIAAIVLGIPFMAGVIAGLTGSTNCRTRRFSSHMNIYRDNETDRE